MTNSLPVPLRIQPRGLVAEPEDFAPIVFNAGLPQLVDIDRRLLDAASGLDALKTILTAIIDAHPNAVAREKRLQIALGALLGTHAKPGMHEKIDHAVLLECAREWHRQVWQPGQLKKGPPQDAPIVEAIVHALPPDHGLWRYAQRSSVLKRLQRKLVRDRATLLAELSAASDWYLNEPSRQVQDVLRQIQKLKIQINLRVPGTH